MAWPPPAREAGVTCSTDSVGGMFGLYFTAEGAAQLRRGDAVRPRAVQPLFHAMLAEGVYLAPSAFEAWLCVCAQ